MRRLLLPALLVLLLLAGVALVVWPRPPEPEPPPRDREQPAEVARGPVPRKLAPVERGRPRDRVVELVPVVPQADRAAPAGATSEDRRPSIRFVVHVTGSDGAAAADATVLLLDPFAHVPPRHGKIEIARASTDANGAAAFLVRESAGGVDVRPVAFRGAESAVGSRHVLARGPEVRAELRLGAALPVHGRVVETGGRPVQGAQLRALIRLPDDDFGFALDGATDAEGAFSLPPVPEGLLAKPAQLEVRARRFPPTDVEFEGDDLRGGGLRIELEPASIASGRVVTPAGSPVAGEQLAFPGQDKPVLSGADGRFEVVVPRAGGVLVAIPGWGAAKTVAECPPGAGDADLGDVTVEAGAPVTGRVVEVDGRPVAQAEIGLELAGLLVATAQADDDGRFRFEAVGEVPHVLIAVEPETGRAGAGRRRATLQDVRGGTQDLQVELTGALSVHVRFLSEDRREPVLVPEVKLTAVGAAGTPDDYGWVWAGSGIDSVRFEVKRAGTFDVTVEVAGYEPATAPGVVVSPVRETKIEVLFRRKPH